MEIIKNISFTQRELDIVACLLSGKPTKVIASLLSIAPRTVETHIQRIMAKINCHSKAQIIDFVEHSAQYGILKQRYISLLSNKDPSVSMDLIIFDSKSVASSSFFSFRINFYIFFLFFIVFFGLTLIGIKSYLFSNTSVHSFLPVSDKRYQLDRPQLLEEIIKKLKKQNGIQTVMLIGIGGSGKTTLARQFVAKYPETIIWFVNAETEKTLQSDLLSLASCLSRSDEDEKQILYIRNEKSDTVIAQKILMYLSKKMSKKKSWVLIFDNLESYDVVDKYLPKDPSVWGAGRIIITSQNSNFIKKFQDRVVEVNTLKKSETLNLFTKITGSKNPDINNPDSLESFLDELPPYPLDISLAAHYIKEFHTEYKDYLNYSKNSGTTFEHLQLQIGESYNKTRYLIMHQIFDKIIKENQAFLGLMLCICLMDSQNIPKSFLDRYEKSETVNDFIHELNKYSIISQNYSKDYGILISMHRSTQKIFLNFIKSHIGSIKISDIVRHYLVYVNQALDQINPVTISFFLNHLQVMGRHSDILVFSDLLKVKLMTGKAYYMIGDFENARLLLKTVSEQSIGLDKYEANSLIGGVLLNFGEYYQAQEILVSSLAKLEKEYPDARKNIAWTYQMLGKFYMQTAQYEASLKCIQKSASLYKENNQRVRHAYAVHELGQIHTLAGNLYEAEKYLKESLSECEKMDLFLIARNNVCLGRVYLLTGNYEKAKILLSKTLDEIKKYTPENTQLIGWTMRQLGEAYRSCNQYKQAFSLFQKAYDMLKKRYGESNINTQWIKGSLGVLLLNTGKTNDALNILATCLPVYEKFLGKSNLDTLFLRCYLGLAYGKAQLFTQAIDTLKICLKLSKEKYGSNHVEYARALFALGKVYEWQNNYVKSKELIEKCNKILYKTEYPNRKFD